MRNLLLVAGLAGVVATAACGGDGRPGTVADGGSGGSSGKTGKAPVAGKSGANEGGAGHPAMEDPLAPVVEIIAPEAIDDPNEAGVLSGTEVEVVCTAKKSSEVGAAEIDGTSIKLQLLDSEGALLEEKSGTPTNNQETYSNTFNLVPIGTGGVAFRCTAEDRDERVGSDEIESLVDKGPVITFIEPEEDGGFHPLEAVLAVDFTVEPALLGNDDAGAAIQKVELEAAGVPIDLDDAETGPGSYHVELILTDGTLFTPPPNGPFLLKVTATNDRAPAPVAAIQTRSLSVDGDGPTISITSPGDKQVVGSEEFLVFEVADAVSGVDPESVVVTLNDDPRKYGEGDWNLTGNVFTYKFASIDVPDAKIQITVGITATDRAGNESKGSSHVLYVDEQPPFVDMNPLNVRSINKDGECTTSFDPLGEAVNDLAKLQPAGLFRTIVYETTNTLPGVVGYLAGTVTESVTLYLRHGDDGPLVEDTTGDGICDDIVDRENAGFLNLDPVSRQGSASWGPDDSTSPAAAALACTTRPVADQADRIMCSGIQSDMRYVIDHATSTEPVVYGVDVGAAASATCTGNGWDISTKLDADGWVCVATRAEDNAGNFTVSPPLRVCVDDFNIPGTPTCLEAQAPACTKGCTPRARWGNVAITLD